MILALEVDDCFMRLIHSITDVLAYTQGFQFTDMTSSPKEAQQIYQQDSNLDLPISDILDTIVVQQNEEPNFWSNYSI